MQHRVLVLDTTSLGTAWKHVKVVLHVRVHGVEDFFPYMRPTLTLPTTGASEFQYNHLRSAGKRAKDQHC